MRRLFLIFLLTLLPLQSALASVCAYCDNDCIPAVVAGAAEQAEETADAEADCPSCHMGGAGIGGILKGDTLTFPPGERASLAADAIGGTGDPGRPERPNWSGPA